MRTFTKLSGLSLVTLAGLSLSACWSDNSGKPLVPATAATYPAAAPMASATGGLNKAGFVTETKDGRLWVFRQGSKEYDEFKKHGELKVMVTRPGAGPNGMTLRAGDAKTLDDYMAAK